MARIKADKPLSVGQWSRLRKWCEDRRAALSESRWAAAFEQHHQLPPGVDISHVETICEAAHIPFGWRSSAL